MCLIRLSSKIQLWLIHHPNCIANFFLSFFYFLELLIYSSDPKEFLQKRSRILGKNYAALGKIIVGEYQQVAEILKSPQKRGHFLGRARMDGKKLPKNFLLFLSDEAAGGSSLHATLHDNIWTLAQSALQTAQGPILTSYIEDGARAWKKASDDVDKVYAIQRMTIQYIFHAIFGTAIKDEAQIRIVEQLFFSVSPWKSYIGGAIRPFANVFQFFQCSRTSLANELRTLILTTPSLQDYIPSEANGNLSAYDYADLLMAGFGIAGLGGTFNLLKNIADFSRDACINVDDKKEVMYAVLEAARVRAPVNNINIIAPTEKNLEVNGKLLTFPKNTIFAASIGLASIDPAVFKNPNTFDHKRENITKDILIFNHVGFSPHGSGTRQCPGRNIAMKLASDFLVLIRA